jgi:hypothetical protein
MIDMTSSFEELLHCAIGADDNAAVVALLEPKVKDGSATEAETLFCGVSLLMAPFGDAEAAASIFFGLLKGNRRFEAAVWDAYRFAVLMPDGDRTFEMVLRSFPQSAVSAHMLSMVADMDGNISLALAENRRSRAMQPFPFNITKALYRDPTLDKDTRDDLWKSVGDLMVSRSAQNDEGVCTIENSLQRYWENLIVGTRVTATVWSEYSRVFGKSDDK